MSSPERPETRESDDEKRTKRYQQRFASTNIAIIIIVVTAAAPPSLISATNKVYRSQFGSFSDVVQDSTDSCANYADCDDGCGEETLVSRKWEKACLNNLNYINLLKKPDSTAFATTSIV